MDHSAARRGAMPFQARQIDPAGSAFARLGAELRARRQASGESLATLSSKSAYSAALIRRVEAPERLPPLEFMQACDRALGAEGALVALWPAAQEERSSAGAVAESVGSQPSASFDPGRSDLVIAQWAQAAT